MKRTTIALMLIGLSSPVLAQEVNPALEGEGNQTQRLDLVGGAVSIGIESSGSTSIGRGEDAIGGGLGVTVNELSIGTGGSNQMVPPGAAKGTGAMPGSSPALGSGGAASTGLACDLMLTSSDELATALDQDFDVMLREVACDQPAPELARLMISQPAFFSMLARAGLPQDRLISITIHNGTVIVDHTRSI